MNEITTQEALRRAIEAHKGGNLSEAERYYSAILKVEPNHPDANHNLGILLLSISQSEKAILLFRKALEVNPNVEQFWLSLLNAYVKSKELEEAKMLFANAKQKGFTGVKFDELEKQLNDIASPLPKNELIKEAPGNIIQKISKCFTQAKFDSTIRSATEHLIMYPNSVKLLNLRAAALASLNRHQEAAKDYQAIIDLCPGDPKAHYNIGLTQVDLGDFDRANSSFGLAIQLDPKYLDAYLALGNLHKAIGRPNDAVKYYKAANLIKKTWQGYNNLGATLLELHHTSDALETLNVALSLNKNHDIYFNIANVHRELGALDEAVKNYRSALNFSPHFIPALVNLGVTLSRLGKFDEAISSYEKVLEISPRIASIYNNIGIIRQTQGLLNLAYESYQKALEIDPDNAEIWNNFGLTLFCLNDKQEAMNVYKKVLSLDPNFSDAKSSLGSLLFEAGDFVSAEELFKSDKSLKAQCFLLKVYLEDDKESAFRTVLNQVLETRANNAVIGSLVSRAEYKFKMSIDNPFCKEPLNYVQMIDLKKHCDFDEVFVKGANKILSESKVQSRQQSLLLNASQTAGNVFNQVGPISQVMQSIIRSQLEHYRMSFMNSNEGLITDWPNEFELDGWLVDMKSGGSITPHMHDRGWLSGSVYINVPDKISPDAGNLVVCIDDGIAAMDDQTTALSLDVVTGSLCLFPSSLLHYTIPFKSDKNRIVLAFDVVPS